MSNWRSNHNPHLDALGSEQFEVKELERKWCCANHRRKAKEAEDAYQTLGMNMSDYGVVHETCEPVE